MEYFDRTHEIKRLQQIRELSEKSAQLTVVTGRRRIGKTSMIIKALEGENFLYVFVTKGTEKELCRDMAQEMKIKLKLPLVGDVSRMEDLLALLMETAKEKPLTLVMDEFQNLQYVNPAIFSYIQKLWDLNKNQAKINFVVCGSVASMMNRLFRDYKEPLYARHTAMMKVEPFETQVLTDIIKSFNPKASGEDVLALFLLTGGVAKYVEHLMDHGATDRETMLRTVVDKDSVFLLEGKSLLIEEFGRDYGRYFDILKLIAEGHNSRSDLEGILGVEISGHLSRLENDYGILSKSKPLLQKSNNRNIRYHIKDHFMRFWFRFFYKYNTFIEANAFEQLRMVVERDYTTYSGKVLEDFFKQRLRESGRFTLVGSWWDRRGENEIDIIAADDLAKSVTFFEVKRQRKEIDLAVLRSKAQHFLQTTGVMGDYDVEYRGLCLEDVIIGDGSR